MFESLLMTYPLNPAFQSSLHPAMSFLSQSGLPIQSVTGLLCFQHLDESRQVLLSGSGQPIQSVMRLLCFQHLDDPQQMLPSQSGLLIQILMGLLCMIFGKVTTSMIVTMLYAMHIY